MTRTADPFVKFLKWWLIVTGVGLLALCVYMVMAGARVARQFDVVGRQGMHAFVVLAHDAPRSREDLVRYARIACSGRVACQASFWADRHNAPTRLPMDAQHWQTMFASYFIRPDKHIARFECSPFGAPEEPCRW